MSENAILLMSMTVGGAFAGGIFVSILNELSEHKWIITVTIWCGSISVVIGVIAFLVNIIGILAFDDIQFSVRPIWAIGGGIVLVLLGAILSELAEYYRNSPNVFMIKAVLVGGVLGCVGALFFDKIKYIYLEFGILAIIGLAVISLLMLVGLFYQIKEDIKEK